MTDRHSASRAKQAAADLRSDAKKLDHRRSLRNTIVHDVAARVDAGGIRVSRRLMNGFAAEHNFACFLETSAKTNVGCEELKKAIVDGIRWDEIPWRSSPILFKRLQEQILRLKDDGTVLMRFNELRDALRLRFAELKEIFTDDELRTAIKLLTGPGIVWELAFGSWVLLQPERINAYAQAVIQSLRADELERGAILEEKVLGGLLIYRSSLERLEPEDERIVLLAMHQSLIERGVCMREHTDKGTLLVFPSFYRRERLEIRQHPTILVSYKFEGFLDDIYATLVVRLHHSQPFKPDQLWRYAADFRTLTGKHVGIKLTRLAEGIGDLKVYFEPSIPVEEKIIFSKYVHEHLSEKGKNLVRIRHYVCQKCGTLVGNQDLAMTRLQSWLDEEYSRRSDRSTKRSWLKKTTNRQLFVSAVNGAFRSGTILSDHFPVRIWRRRFVNCGSKQQQRLTRKVRKNLIHDQSSIGQIVRGTA